MSAGQLQQTIQHFRSLLLQHNAQSEAQLNAAYKGVLANIQPALNKLYDEMIAEMSNGEKIPLHWLYEAQRLETLKKLLTGQINHFGALARMTAGQMQQFAVNLGKQAGLAQLYATVPTGVHWSFGVPDPKALANLVGATESGPLADLFAGFGEKAAADAQTVLVSALANGDNPRSIASRLAQSLQEPRWRALTTARTEMIRSYRMANLESYRANSDVCQGWIWICALLKTSCAACVAMHGSHHSLDEELNDHPCGACTPAPETKDWAEILGPLGVDTSDIPNTTLQVQSGTDWLDNQDEATQRAILGAKYDGWSNGDFTLRDIVGVNKSNKWGDSIREKSLKELVTP